MRRGPGKLPDIAQLHICRIDGLLPNVTQGRFNVSDVGRLRRKIVLATLKKFLLLVGNFARPFRQIAFERRLTLFGVVKSNYKIKLAQSYFVDKLDLGLGSPMNKPAIKCSESFSL